MNEKTFKVPNIGCDGCVRAIQGELTELNGVVKVDGDVDSQMVTVQWNDPASWEQITATLTEIEYAPEAV